MCLYVKKGEGIRQAKEDIVVYKALLKNNEAPFQGFEYKRNVFLPEVHLQIKTEVRPWLRTEEGPLLFVKEGYHTSTCYHSAKHRFGWCKVVAMVIPKGAYYILGEHKEVVSSTLFTHDLRSVE